MKKKSCDRLHYTLLGTTVLFLGAFVGSLFLDLQAASNDNDMDIAQGVVRLGDQTYVAVKNLTDEFKVELEKGNEFAVYNGKTWIPVLGNPIELLVLNDPNCGKKCDTSQALATLRQVLTPALLVRTVDVDSEEGKALISTFEVSSIPQFLLGDGIRDHVSSNGTKFLEASQEVLTEKDNLFLVDSGKVGFPVGTFLEAPTFADMGIEPAQGNGKVQVVEFTDYQCPYCKRLHDNNKASIKKLIADGKIKYVMKDFPLGFHKEAMDAHVAANCAQKIGDNETYWHMHDKIFDTQSQWSGKGAGARAHFKTLAKELVLDEEAFGACMNDEAMKEEVRADQAEGSQFGVSGTPALFIGKQMMPGAIGSATFEQAVEDEINN